MPHCSGTHLLTLLVQHATLSESGSIRACSYTQDNSLVTYSGKPETCYYFTYDALIEVCYMGMPESITTAGV